MYLSVYMYILCMYNFYLCVYILCICIYIYIYIGNMPLSFIERAGEITIKALHIDDDTEIPLFHFYTHIQIVCSTTRNHLR